MALKNRNIRPPTGFVFTERATGHAMSAVTFDELLVLVRSHRVANKLPRTAPHEIAEDIDNHICGLMRGTRALWTFCTTRIPMPSKRSKHAAIAARLEAAAPPVRQPGQTFRRPRRTPRTLVERKNAKKPCPTCAKRAAAIKERQIRAQSLAR